MTGPDKSRPGGAAAEPTAPRRRLPAPQRRVLILDAAAGLFASRGFHAAAMDEIATAAGISKAVVYDHFSSKRQLYLELLTSIRADLDAVVDAALAPIEARSEARMRVALDAFFRYVEDHPDACRLLFLEVQGTAETAEVVRAIEAGVAERLSATLGANPRIFAGHATRERQIHILAELIKSSIHGLASWWYRHPDVPREDLVERAVAFTWPAIVRAGGGEPAA